MTNHIDREHQPLKSKPNVLENVNNDIENILLEKQKHNNNPNDFTYENHAHIVIEPKNVGKT